MRAVRASRSFKGNAALKPVPALPAKTKPALSPYLITSAPKPTRVPSGSAKRPMTNSCEHTRVSTILGMSSADDLWPCDLAAASACPASFVVALTVGNDKSPSGDCRSSAWMAEDRRVAGVVVSGLSTDQALLGSQFMMSLPMKCTPRNIKIVAISNYLV